MRSHAHQMIKKLPSPKKTATIMLLCCIVAVVALSLIPWQQFALGSGTVIAFSPTERRHTVNAPVNGRIKKWHVNEGTRVKPGDPIVDMSDNDPEILSRLALEKQEILLKIAAADQAVAAGKANLDRQQRLYHQGIHSKRQYELAQIEYASYQNQRAQRNIDKIKVELRIARQKTQIITAPAAGTVFKRLTGQESVMVKAGDVLAHIMPLTSSRAVELWIDGKDIPFVRLHQTARLQFEGWPAVQFHGWPEIAVGTFRGNVSFIDPTDNGLGLFRVVIVPAERWPDGRYLRQGVRVHGWIQLGKVPLWYELWRQFNGFPPESVAEKPV